MNKFLFISLLISAPFAFAQSEEELQLRRKIEKPHNCLVYVDTVDKIGLKKQALYPLKALSEEQCKVNAKAFNVSSDKYIKSRKVKAVWVGNVK